jgi:hypothetical protein
MKKLITLLMMMASLTFFSSSVLALESEGVIEELKHCRTGNNWRTLLFKIEGNWFGLYSDYYNHVNSGINDFLASSMIMQAFAAGYTVKVKASTAWNSDMSACGDDIGHYIHKDKGDYIQLIK